MIDVGAYSLANANGVPAPSGTDETVDLGCVGNCNRHGLWRRRRYPNSHGEILVDAESNAISVGLSVNLEGGALALDAIFDGGTKATSTATGMSGDDGVDTLRNFGRIGVGKGVATDSRHVRSAWRAHRASRP